MVKYSPIASNYLTAANPPIFWHIKLDLNVYKNPIASGRNFCWRNIEYQIWFTKRPFRFRPLQICKRIVVSILWRPGFNPGNNISNVFVIYKPIIYELTNMSINLSWGHTTRQQNFANHWRPTLNHGVTIHSKRRYTTLAMTSCALLGQYRRHI